MTRLSLHSRDENPSLSIRLRVGQYCTVGSSTAADYCIRGDGIEPVHCRIGCQTSGGYVECFNPLTNIVINDSPKDRTRLSHGDQLSIGSVHLIVDLPKEEIETPNFSLSFEDESTPTTKVAETVEFDHNKYAADHGGTLTIETDVDDSNNETGADSEADIDLDPQANQNSESSSSDSSSEFDDEMSDLDSTAIPTTFDSDGPDSDWDLPEDLVSESENTEEQADENVELGSSMIEIHESINVSILDPLDSTDAELEAFADSDDEKSESASSRETSSESKSSADTPEKVADETVDKQSSKSMTFEFDSADPTDIQLTSSELKNLTDDDSPEFSDLGSLDLEAELDERDQLGDKNQPNDQVLSRGEFLPGGSQIGKHYRWNGLAAVDGIEAITSDPKIKIYRSSFKQITLERFEEVSLKWFQNQDASVFLLSRMEMPDLLQLLRKRRWEDRIGHPQAITMFLALSPKRILAEFFEAFDACVIVGEADVELLRFSNRIP
ncbi:MAG: FHA domain-containing protein [Mariniblastus sp.]